MHLFSIAEIAIFAPLAGFLIAGLAETFGALPPDKSKIRDRLAQIATCSLVGLCLIASGVLFQKVGLDHHPGTSLLIPWIECAHFKVHWGIRLDALSITMMVIVSLVSFLVHIYSIGYMSHDHSTPRFMAYLSLFTFAMLILVTAPNLLQLFFGWEGVGLASYLLIGFWYEKPAANQAALKAFLVNRVGDTGLILGICAIFYLFETVDFDLLLNKFLAYSEPGGHLLPVQPTMVYFGFQADAFNLIGILLFIGAMGKSAQLGLHTWLADAMEGPTPVSALIHAATMVTAGVFLIVRMSPLYELAPLARDIICLVGIFTAFFGAMVAMTQNDIKRIIAFSTCSQLGYMFLAAGLSAYGAAMFHLITHAFFKALLFLGAGAVIHGMSGEQDIRRMGGIRKMIPLTYAMMWVGSLALAGIPFFSGYYSKEAILKAAYLNGSCLAQFCWLMGGGVAALTAFYSGRLLILTFHGKPRADERVMAHVHEAPLTMKVSLYVLAAGAILCGYLTHELFLDSSFWGREVAYKVFSSPETAIPYSALFFPVACILAGSVTAFVFYMMKPDWPLLMAGRFKKIYQFFLNKGFFDEFYDRFIIEYILKLSHRFWKHGDERIINRFGPDGFALLSFRFAQVASHLQTGYLYHYAFAMVLGIILLTAWILIVQGV